MIGSLQEDLALERLAARALEAEAEALWRARHYRLSLVRKAEADCAHEHVRDLERVAA